MYFTGGRDTNLPSVCETILKFSNFAGNAEAQEEGKKKKKKEVPPIPISAAAPIIRCSEIIIIR